MVFDLDGVLVAAKETHFLSLNQALSKINELFVISEADHLSRFDGLPTNRKLEMLTQERGLDPSLHKQIWTDKQSATRELIDAFQPDERLRSVLKSLRDRGLIICVASNSIKDTVEQMLTKRGFIEFIDFFVSNQDVSRPKPNPEMYLECMRRTGIGPLETLIVEDSPVGQEAARASGATVCPVRDPDDVSLEKIERFLTKPPLPTRWKAPEMNILIPMAGAGSRFEAAGYTFPKPLIDVKGKPMIQMVVENIGIEGRYIYVVQKAHYEKYNLKYLLNLITPNCEIVQVEGITQGAACTTLLAKELINSDQPLLMANSDQWVDWNPSEVMYSFQNSTADAGMLTFTATHPRWSFARLGENGFVAEVAEKKPISDIATVGVYFWKHGSDYVKYAEQMIAREIRVNNEFYVCPVFNEAIGDGKKVRVYPVKRMFGTGTPEDLNAFLQAGVL